jgi:tRNA dimethylallyltransferase
MKKTDSIIIIAGPTACGKSALAMDLVKQLNGCIINADSLQIYDDLPILTARPSPDDLKQAPHKLYGFLKGTERFSVARWREMALDAIDWSRKNNLQPIIVGGTGLYLMALMQGISAVPTIPPEIFHELENLELDDLYITLLLEDPDMALKLHPNDRQRITRALSVMRATGKSLSAWQAQDSDGTTEHAYTKILILPEREELNLIAEHRFDHMMAAGALQEVKDLLAKGYPSSAPIFKAVGASQLVAHLEGKHSLDEAITLAKIATRQYIKRQYTWFRWQFESDVTLSFPYSHPHLSSIQEFINRDQNF